MDGGFEGRCAKWAGNAFFERGSLPMRQKDAEPRPAPRAAHLRRARQKDEDAEVEEEHNDSGGDEEGTVVGPVRPAEAGLPDGGAEDDHGQEEDACDFKPDNSADAAKGAQEAADPGGDAARSLAGNLAGGAGLGGSGAGWSGGGGWPAGGGLGASGNALAGDAAGDAQADAESAAYGLRFHFALMVTARRGGTAGQIVCKFRVALRRRWK